MNTLWRLLTGLARALTLPPLRALGGLLAGMALPFARAAAGVSMIIAAVALAHDLGPAMATARNASVQSTAGFSPTSVMRHWEQLAPQSHKATRAFATQRMPQAWSLVAGIFALPAFVAFTGFALIFGYFGRRRRRVEIFAN